MTAVPQQTVLTGCLAPIDKGGLEQLIANGKANPKVIKTYSHTSGAFPTSAHAHAHAHARTRRHTHTRTHARTHTHTHFIAILSLI